MLAQAKHSPSGMCGVLRPGQEAGKCLEMEANGFRERGLESVINSQDTVSALNA